MAAALALGAAGVNVGTRFLASEEASAHEQWKQRILEIDSETAVRFETWAAFMPLTERGYKVVPRVIDTDFVATWQGRLDEARDQADRLRDEIIESIQHGRPHDLTPSLDSRRG